jgi:hypothetical protein
MTAWIIVMTVRESTWLGSRVYVGLVFFDLLFLVTSLHHHVHRVIVDAEGMTITGLLQISSVHWRDIIKHERGFGLHFWTRDGGLFSLSPLDTERFDDLANMFARHRMLPQEYEDHDIVKRQYDEQPRWRLGKHRRHRKY